MDGEPVVYREEVTTIMIVLGDIRTTLDKIYELLEDVHGEDQEEDA